MDATCVKECRICLGDELSKGDAWLSPCRCAGSIKWVHQQCHNQWLTVALKHGAEHRCPTCKTTYHGHWNWKDLTAIVCLVVYTGLLVLVTYLRC